MALQCRTCDALERALAGRTAGGQMSGQELLQELWKPNAKFNRGGRIRTGDLLVPNHAPTGRKRASCTCSRRNWCKMRVAGPCPARDATGKWQTKCQTG